MGMGDGGWGDDVTEGSTEDFSTQRDQAVHSNRGHMPDTLGSNPPEAPRAEANHRLSDNDVPTQIQTAMSAPHPGRLLQWRAVY